jgi:hypothetical protein
LVRKVLTPRLPDAGHGGNGDGQRGEVDQHFALVPVITDLPHNRRRQALPGTAAKAAHLRQPQAKHFGHHPGANREISTA